MLSSSTFVLCLGILLCADAHTLAKNTVHDALIQSSKLLRCWELVDSHNPSSGFTLSEPIYPFCSYMPYPKDYNKFFVNGVEENSDDYNSINNIFNGASANHAVLNVCLQEAFQFHRSEFPSQVSLRCLCKRDACNIPGTLTAFLDFNKKPIPQEDHQ